MENFFFNRKFFYWPSQNILTHFEVNIYISDVVFLKWMAFLCKKLRITFFSNSFSYFFPVWVISHYVHFRIRMAFKMLPCLVFGYHKTAKCKFYDLSEKLTNKTSLYVTLNSLKYKSFLLLKGIFFLILRSLF